MNQLVPHSLKLKAKFPCSWNLQGFELSESPVTSEKSPLTVLYLPPSAPTMPPSQLLLLMHARSSLTTEPQQLSSYELECIFPLTAAWGHTLSICSFSFQTQRFLDNFPGHSDSLKRILTLEFHFLEARLVMFPLITYQYENISYWLNSCLAIWLISHTRMRTPWG